MVIRNLLFWVIYFLPSIVAWFRKRSGKSIPLPFGLIFWGNLFFGWTGLAWVLLLVNAFGYNPVPWLAVRIAKFYAVPGSAGVPRTAAEPADAQSHLCGQCGGTGTMSCSHCAGRGSWYTQPASANEVAQLQTCSYCMSSGRIRCSYCGGASV